MNRYLIQGNYGTFVIERTVVAESDDDARDQGGIMSTLMLAGWTFTESPDGEEWEVTLLEENVDPCFGTFYPILNDDRPEQGHCALAPGHDGLHQDAFGNTWGVPPLQKYQIVGMAAMMAEPLVCGAPHVHPPHYMGMGEQCEGRSK